HPDVDLQAALHLADDGALDRTVALEGTLDVAPHDQLERLLARQVDVAALRVRGLEVHVDRVALVHGQLAGARGALWERGASAVRGRSPCPWTRSTRRPCRPRARSARRRAR